MTSKQWTALGTIVAAFGTIATIIVGAHSANMESTVVNGTYNKNSQIGQQNNYYDTAADPSFENTRASDTKYLTGKNLITAWFDLMNNGRYQDGCSLQSRDKCNSSKGSDVLNHSHEIKTRVVDGYHLDNVWHSGSAPSDVWCVKYQYRDRLYSGGDIILVMQYKLSPREDGGQDIASRGCEKVWMAGEGERQCSPDVSPHYCI